MNENCTISIDAGGTNIKSCLILDNGEAVEGTMLKIPSFSNESAEKIFSSQARTIREQLNNSRHSGLDVNGIVFSFPGPFDYSAGACLMRHKYTAIYNKPVISELSKVIDLPESCGIRFYHDLHSYTYGEYIYGAGKSFSSLLGVTIGTGLGTGVVLNDHIVHDGKGGPSYPIFEKPCENGILEDRVSARGIVNHYCRLKGGIPPEELDPRKIANLALNEKEPEAIKTYVEMGTLLGQFLSPLIDSLEIECLVFGGEISRSFKLFGPNLKDKLRNCKSLHAVEVSKDLEYTALKGAAALLNQEIKQDVPVQRHTG